MPFGGKGHPSWYLTFSPFWLGRVVAHDDGHVVEIKTEMMKGPFTGDFHRLASYNFVVAGAPYHIRCAKGWIMKGQAIRGEDDREFLQSHINDYACQLARLTAPRRQVVLKQIQDKFPRWLPVKVDLTHPAYSHLLYQFPVEFTPPFRLSRFEDYPAYLAITDLIQAAAKEEAREAEAKLWDVVVLAEPGCTG